MAYHSTSDMMTQEQDPNSTKKCPVCRHSIPILEYGNKFACTPCNAKRTDNARKWRARQIVASVPEGQKQCTRCYKIKTLEAFGGFAVCAHCRTVMAMRKKKKRNENIEVTREMWRRERKIAYAKKKAAGGPRTKRATVNMDGLRLCSRCFVDELRVTLPANRKTCLQCSERSQKRYANPTVKNKKSAWGKLRYQKNKASIKRYSDNYRRTHLHIYRKSALAWRKRNLDKARLSGKISKQKRVHQVRAWRRARHKERMINDPIYRVAYTCRSRIRCALQRAKRGKPFKSMEILGCDWETLKTHIESQFEPWMTWHNHGNRVGCWEIDHIVPIDAFNLQDNAQVLVAFNYKNLQPMAHEENRDKSSKMPWEIAA